MWYICKFVVDGNNSLMDFGVFVICIVGFFDGFCVDWMGCIWISVGDGVYCYDLDGMFIGKIKILEIVFNVIFGGVKCNCFFIMVMILFYVVYLMVNGLKLG